MEVGKSTAAAGRSLPLAESRRRRRGKIVAESGSLGAEFSKAHKGSCSLLRTSRASPVRRLPPREGASSDAVSLTEILRCCWAMDAAPPRQDPSGSSSSLLASSAVPTAASQAAAAQAAASSPSPAFRTGKHKSCDACKARKVKCPSTSISSISYRTMWLADGRGREEISQTSDKTASLSLSNTNKTADANYPAPCGNCVVSEQNPSHTAPVAHRSQRRKTTCHFGTKKVPRRNGRWCSLLPRTLPSPSPGTMAS